MDTVCILGILLATWLMLSLRRVMDYSPEPVWKQALFSMLYDVQLLGVVAKEVGLTLLGIPLFLLLPAMLLAGWVHTKWTERT